MRGWHGKGFSSWETFQKAAVISVAAGRAPPRPRAKAGIVCVPVNHPEHAQEHRNVVPCEQGVRERDGRASGAGCANAGIEVQSSPLGRALRISAAILTMCQRAAALPRALWKKWEGWWAGVPQLPCASSSSSALPQPGLHYPFRKAFCI